MKPKFKARELWLFAPFLLIGGLAFVWQRAGKVSSPTDYWTTTSTVKVEAAPGYYQEQGKLHRVTVTLSHPWPRPRWWGKSYSLVTGLDPTDVERSALRPLGQVGGLGEARAVRSGALFSTRDAKNAVTIPPKQGILNATPRFNGDKCTFDYYINLNSIAVPPQPLTLRGAYIFGGSSPVKIEKLIRKAGEKWSFEVDKSPGADLLSVNAASRFYQSSRHAVGKPVEYTDFTSIFFLLRPELAVTDESNKQNFVRIYDLEIRDEKGRKYREYKPYGVFFSETNFIKPAANQVHSGEILYQLSTEIDNKIPTSGALTLTGKISVAEHWPLLFKIKLPSRKSATPSWSHEETWMRSAKVLPIR